MINALEHSTLFSTARTWVAGLIICLGSFHVQAQETYHVTRADDPMPAEEGTLRWAVDQANMSPGQDIVIIDRDAIGIDDGSGNVIAEIQLVDQIDITESVIIESSTAPLSQRISINGPEMSRIFSFSPGTDDTESTLQIRRLDLLDSQTQADGDPESCGPEAGQGGAICALGNVQLFLSTIRGSSTSGQNAPGGAIWATGEVSLSASRVSGNSTTGPNSYGGGVAADSVFCIQGIVENNATEGDDSPGGGIWSEGEVLGNLCRVSGNETYGLQSHGGGIFAQSLVTFVNGSINVSFNATNDSSAFGGGAFVNWIGAHQSSFSSNRVEQGRGSAIFVLGVDGRSQNSTIANSTVMENVGDRAIVLDSVSAQDGVGFSVDIVSSIVALSEVSGFPGPFLVEGVDVADSETHPIFVNQIANYPEDVVGQAGGDPLLSELSSPGYCWFGVGEFLDLVSLGGECMEGHMPLPGSPVIDQGNADWLFGVEFDTRDKGFARNIGADIDIGAVESSSVIHYFATNNAARLDRFLYIEFVAESGASCSRTGLPGTEWDAAEFAPLGSPESLVIEMTGLDLEALELTIEDLPVELEIELSCELPGDPPVSETRLSSFELQPPVLAIEEFSIDPSEVLQGEVISASWSTNDPGAGDISCTGGGLPGTTWNSEGKPRQGTEVVSTQPLEPGSYIVTLECTRVVDNEIVESASAQQELLVLQSAMLELSAAKLAVPLPDQHFVEFLARNESEAMAVGLVFSSTIPGSGNLVAGYRLAPDCERRPGDPVEAVCNVDQIPDWECFVDGNELGCVLDELPPGGVAGLVVHLAGSDLIELEGSISADNADEQTASITVGN